MTRINTNVSSLVAQKTLSRSHDTLQQSLTRLSTGLKINVGKDDPAGLIASEILRSDIVSVNRAITNSERANQLIATADSALGQVSSLLNDIRGLVSEAANTGALSEDQIAANQLQLDSSLEAIDRISQTTAFQGSRLLDGSLDFLATSAGTSDIRASGTFGTALDVRASGNFGTTTTTNASGNFGSVGVRSTAVLTANGPGAVTFSAIAVGSDNNGYEIKYTQASAGTASAAFDGTAKTITITIGSASTAASVVAAIVANASASAVFSASATGAGIILTANTADGVTAFSATTASGQNYNNIILSAVTGGTAFNGIDVVFADTTATGAEAATYDTASKTLTVNKNASSTLSQVLTAITATGVVSASSTGSTSGVYSATPTSDVTTGATDSNNIILSAVNAGARFNNVNISFANSVAAGAEVATYTTATNTIAVAKNAASTTNQVIAAVNASGVFSAGTAGGGATTYSATPTSNITSSGSDNNVLVISAANGGAAYNGLSIVTQNTVGTGSESASYATATNTLTISKNASSTSAQLITAINTNGTFSASTSGAGLGIYAAATTTNVTTGGATGSASISALRVDQANFGTASSIGLHVDIDQQATKGTLTYSGGALASDLVLEVGGKNGFEVFNFGAGTTVAQIASALNLVADATGVSAATSGTGLEITSSEYGTDSFVSAKALTGSFVALDALGASATRSNGTDVALRINGVAATGKGLNVSLNTSTLDINFAVNDNFQDGDSFDFALTGGGATFQLGPDVVSNQQARLGIQGVSSATLGGVSGTLFELRSGGSKSLAVDVKAAAKVVDEVITSVTSLRGRLGAFQKTTLETNIFTLNDTLESLTDAESSIRDADFAYESAKLTRAQILVQSGTSVLAIANQNPQSVLSLLR